MREPPLVWVISRRSPGGGEVFLTGLRADGVPLWSQWWHIALRYATAPEALDALRAHTPEGTKVDWGIQRITERCLRTS